MTTAITPRTNGDRVQPLVDRAKKRLAERARWAREHPDEAAAVALPMLAVAWAIRRHELSAVEAYVVFEAGYWCGVFALQQYRDWKDRPVRPTLKEVI